jgi:hypothetical protein
MAFDMPFLGLSGFNRVACNQLQYIPRTRDRSDPDLRQAKALEQRAERDLKLILDGTLGIDHV